MALPKLLTETHWKTNGLPKRSLTEKLKQKKTGISEALRAVDAADKALLADILNSALAKKMAAALTALEKALKELKAEDKALVKLRNDMVGAIADHRRDHNAILSKISRGTLGGVPGGLKSLQKQAQAEFSTENQTFIEAAMKVATDPLKIMALMDKMVDDINIANRPKWQALVKQRADWEAEVKHELAVSLKQVVKTQEDTVDRVKAGAFI